jgi:hypothetical protein
VIGRRLYGESVAAAAGPANPPRPLPDLDGRGYRVEIFPPGSFPVESGPLPEGLDKELFAGLGHPTTERARAWTKLRGRRGGKVLLCFANFAQRDKLWGKKERVPWSDVWAEGLAQVAQKFGGSMAEMEAIWRVKISNQVSTKSIFLRCQLQVDFGHSSFCHSMSALRYTTLLRGSLRE